MTDKNETAVLAAAPERSKARQVLAARIMAREKALEAVEASQAAGQRLQEHGHHAAALAAKLEAERAADAERLAQHAISGEGEPPKLTDSARIQLHADLVEAQAQEAAAQPAIQKVTARTAELGQAHHRAALAVHPCLHPILQEEATSLALEIRDLSAKLYPLQQRLVGLKQHVYTTAHAHGDDRRQAYLLFGSDLDGMLKALGVNSQTSAGEFESQWAAFTLGLTTNPDRERP